MRFRGLLAVLLVVGAVIAAGYVGTAGDESASTTTSGEAISIAATTTTVAETTTTVEPTTTTTTTAVPSAWQRLEVDPLFAEAGSSIRGGEEVLEFGDGLLVWTHHGVVALAYQPREWTVVVDGRYHGQVADPSYAVADGLHGVAVGEAGVVAADHSGVLFSHDGIGWERVSDGWVAWDVAVFNGAYLAAGNGGPSESGVVYRSVDGREWTQVQATETADSCVDPDLVVADSYVVALHHCDAPVSPWWRSDDGISWTDVTPPHLDSVRDCTTGLSAASGDLVVVDEYCNTGEDTLWVTSDGASWEPVEDAPQGGWGDLVAAGPGFLGVLSDPANDATQAVVTSVDGRSWTTVEVLAPAIPTAEALYGWVCPDPSDPGPCQPTMVSGPHLRWFGASLRSSGGTTFALGEAYVSLGKEDLDCPIRVPVMWNTSDLVTWDAVEIDLDMFTPPAPCGSEGDGVVTVIADGDEYVFLGSGVWVWTPPGA